MIFKNNIIYIDKVCKKCFSCDRMKLKTVERVMILQENPRDWVITTICHSCFKQRVHTRNRG